MIAARYPDIDDIKATLELAMNGLSQHLVLAIFSLNFITNPHKSLGELGNVLKLYKLKPDQGAQAIQVKQKKGQGSQRLPQYRRKQDRRAPIPRPQAHNGPWCTLHGVATHTDAQCFAQICRRTAAKENFADANSGSYSDSIKKESINNISEYPLDSGCSLTQVD